MDDIYIKVLKYAKDNPGFTRGQLHKEFPEDYSWIHREYGRRNLFQTVTVKDKGENKIYLSFEDRFRLLEYEELKEARASAEQAKKMSMVAIAISAFLALSSILESAEFSAILARSDVGHNDR